jgi:hypothetical protein
VGVLPEKDYRVGDLRRDIWGTEYKLCTCIVLDPHPDTPAKQGTVWVKQRKRNMRRFVENPYVEFYRRISQMKDDQVSNQKKAGKWEMPSDPFLGPYPTIAQYLTDCFWDDGRSRIPCKLGVKWWGSCVDVSLNDEGKRRSCVTTADTLEEALTLLESHLADGGAPWRQWGPAKK